MKVQVDSKMSYYEPELGQAVFGQPHKEFEVPEWLTALLLYFRQEVSRIEWNSLQKHFDPFGNTAQSYKNDTFEVVSYSWDDTREQLHNFKWKDFEISWYKYFGRGMSMNREISIEEGIQMLTECLDSIRAKEIVKE